MATIKRNAPCPCGSGKKYKKCCLLKVQAAPAFSPLDRKAFNELLPRVFDYSKQFDDVLQPVYEKYVSSFNILPAKDAKVFSQLMFHWLLFSYPLLNGNKTVLASYIDTYTHTYSETFQRFLQKWETLTPAFYNVTYADKKAMVIEHAFNKDALTLGKTPASADLHENDSVIGYLYPAPDGHALGNDALGVPAYLASKFLSIWPAMVQVLKDNADEATLFDRHFPEVLHSIAVFVAKGDALHNEDKLPESSQAVLTLLYDKLDWEHVSYPIFLETKARWITYTLEEKPRIQKPETYAAALHYWLGKHLQTDAALSQKAVADLYSVSSGTVGTRYKSLNEQL
ncbi:SEC-C domain-containing protein [Salipaludibacillus agaradhaerens]|uniref:SEC-C metal-binding domain-containing protein n=1 Tax=Salipaludibacillus agaradhaerens TaxID=76935 RepID=UPI002150B23D|nr:SEC-C metal-binding domain-containing protein [Salipaludibacillus agaradhaerens]MCR6105650.1 SEC-C domain-containing protein [Salipaludibacillus agaradhaerens]MCR6117687.1 SEC-C domain-containing protein [Salipaludibacillus agaradhaerens]